DVFAEFRRQWQAACRRTGRILRLAKVPGLFAEQTTENTHGRFAFSRPTHPETATVFWRRVERGDITAQEAEDNLSDCLSLNRGRCSS
ncbi:MAG: hypothetical protein DMG09_24485, partial [Acidobacteria bacterium]